MMTNDSCQPNPIQDLCPSYSPINVIDYDKQLPMLKPLATGVIFNTRAELPVGRPSVLSNGDNFKIGDTIFLYQETE